MKYWEELTTRWRLKHLLAAEEPTDWASMLTACGRVHRTCLADLREALQPRLALPDRQAKGAPKGDRGKGRNGSTTTTDQDEGKTRKRKGRNGGKGDGGKRKRKGKGERGESTERATKKKKGEHTTPTLALTDTKGNGKTRKPKSEIPCRFHKRGHCDRDPCEFKH